MPAERLAASKALARRAGRPPLQGAAAGRRGPAPSANSPPSAATSSAAASPPGARALRRAPWSTTSALLETLRRAGTAWPSPRTARPRWRRSSSPANSSTAPGASPRPSRTRCASTARSASGGSSSPTSSWTPPRCAGSAAELDADPGFRFVCYVDSVRGVELMDAALRGAGPARPVDVVVELGAGEGARTGARTEDGVRARSPTRWPRRARCGWSASPATRARCRDADPRAGARLAAPAGRAGRAASTPRAASRTLDEIVVSAGGSAWFDAVADVFAELPELSAPVLQAAALRRVRLARRRPLPRPDPLQPGPGGGRAAARLPAVGAGASPAPRRSQAFLNAGKRDAAYDLGLPAAAGRPLRPGRRRAPGHRHHRHRLSDQHAWLRTGRRRGLEVGDWVGARPVPPVHDLRQVAADPAGRGGRHGHRLRPHLLLTARGDRGPPLRSRHPGRGRRRRQRRSRLPRRRRGRRRPHRGDRRARRRPPSRQRPARAPAVWTPTAWCCPPASSTCTPTATSPCCATRPQAKAAQGVTLEVLGQDGLSYAPVDDRTLAEVRAQIAGWNGDGADVDFDWRTVGEYLDRLDRRRGHRRQRRLPRARRAPSRMLAVGWEDRAGHRARTATGCGGWSPRACEQGAVGHVLRADVHPRHVRLRRRTDRAVPGGGAATAATTARTTARTARARCAAYAEMVGAGPGGRLRPAPRARHHELRRERGPGARAAGAAGRRAGATAPTSPWTPIRTPPGCTTLAAMLPSWASEGGPEATLARLRGRRDRRADPARAWRSRARTAATGCPIDWDTIEISGVGDPALAGYVGRTVAAAARRARRGAVRHRPPAAARRPARHDDPAARRPRGERPGDHAAPRPHRRQRRHPAGRQAAPARVRHVPAVPGPLRARAGGALAGGVRRPPHRPPGRPAAAARPGPGPRGLPRRPGALRPARRWPRAPPSTAPRTLPTGIPHVLIDGRFVIEDGRRTDVLAGRSVRRAPARAQGAR